MNPDGIELAKDALLRVHAEELRAKDPGLSYARSYQLAQEQHPDLQESFAQEEQTAAATTPIYRYDPHKLSSAPTKTSWSDVLDLMERYAKERGAKERVEAVDPDPDEKPYLVYGQAVKLE
jgi:hypothetical protein